tara:strand:+ start:40 stop:777 length:738 start_codon:yes stop_codon:yes gene_type:complete
MSKLITNTIRHTGASSDNVTLTSDGKIVGVNQASPTVGYGCDASVHVHSALSSGTRGAALHLTTNASGATASDGARIAQVDSDLTIDNRESGILNFLTAGTERMRIDANGYVTKPANPTFNVKKLGNENGTYNHSAGDLIWATENYDIGGGYNTTNGRYTAPVTGYYFFTFNLIYAIDAGHTIRYSINGSTEMEFHFNTTTTSRWDGRTYTCTLQLDVNDYVTCYHNTATLYGSYYSNWSGFLIG